MRIRAPCLSGNEACGSVRTDQAAAQPCALRAVGCWSSTALQQRCNIGLEALLEEVPSRYYRQGVGVSSVSIALVSLDL